jgi:hypothetical protein
VAGSATQPTRDPLARALALEGAFEFLERPGLWLWFLIAAGVVLRALLVVFTQGTYDALIWKALAEGIHTHGLLEQYRLSAALNHPPLAAWIATRLLDLSVATGIPFRILFRAPTALVDLGSAALLCRILRGNRYRWVVTGLYAVHPVALIFSAYHGNTDSVIAFFLLLCVWSASAGRPVVTGCLLGVSLWIKLPGILAAPALGFVFPRWRDRLAFGAALLVTGALTYVPLLVVDPEIVFRRVLSYQGLIILTSAGVRIWGLQNFLYLTGALPDAWQERIAAAVEWWLGHSTLVVLVPLVIFAWLRRRKREALEVGATLAGCYAIVYALSNFWSFQYLAWSVPLWFLAGGAFAFGATVTAGAYVYAVYAFVCESPFLLGAWDFNGHPQWPWYLELMRDCAVLFFAAASLVFLWRAVRDEWRSRDSKTSIATAGDPA